MSDWRVSFLIVSGLIVLAGCVYLVVLAKRHQDRMSALKACEDVLAQRYLGED